MSDAVQNPVTKSERTLLRVLQVFGYLGMATVALSTVLSAAIPAITQGVPVPLTLNDPGITNEVPGASAERWDGTVTVEAAPWYLLALLLTSALLSGGGIILALFAVTRIAARMLRGDTFAARAKNAFMWAAIGIALAFIGNQLVPAVMSMMAWDHLGNPASFGAVAEINFWPLFFIAALGAASVAFRTGQSAKDDSEGLV